MWSASFELLQENKRSGFCMQWKILNPSPTFSKETSATCHTIPARYMRSSKFQIYSSNPAVIPNQLLQQERSHHVTVEYIILMVRISFCCVMVDTFLHFCWISVGHSHYLSFVLRICFLARSIFLAFMWHLIKLILFCSSYCAIARRCLLTIHYLTLYKFFF